MCEKDNIWLDHLSKQLRPWLLDKYSIKPSNERSDYISNILYYYIIYQIILDSLEHFKRAV